MTHLVSQNLSCIRLKYNSASIVDITLTYHEWSVLLKISVDSNYRPSSCRNEFFFCYSQHPRNISVVKIGPSCNANQTCSFHCYSRVKIEDSVTTVATDLRKNFNRQFSPRLLKMFDLFQNRTATCKIPL